MEIVEGILKVSGILYGLCESLNHCKYQKKRLVDRMDMLLPPIRLLQQKQPPEECSSDLKRMLKRMLDLLEEAEKLLEKYCSQKWMERLVKAGSMLDKLKGLNSRLGDVGNGLTLLLQVEATVQARFEKHVVVQEDRQDLAEDKVSLSETLKGQEVRNPMNITEIKRSELVIKSRVMDGERFELYRGEFYKSPVAVKVFKNLLNNSPQNVRGIFEREARTMKMFESPYVLRLYGICIEENESVPRYSIVTEYCEKGNLREVLQKEPNLPWEIRTEMASDAAAGLYRLHQTGEKTHLHCCIDSTKFLVGKGYCVKLSGFELSQTMSSIQRHPKKVQKVVSASAYICPEGLKSMDHEYTLASDIYSFGVVLWEIATGKLPFAGCTGEEIYKKVVVNKEQEPLGEDCPSVLRDIIDQCRHFSPSQRPSVEEIVNKLHSVTGVTE